ncbi:uncharacterized protein LOC121367657 [Gigantopelta aegis]|uniref:uncharacterized protein LOC121367657 n=1 Tax=Gigantopelta aegis TaxID=1735272 RepID=UPI001B88C6F8|nr:uncharacterized protein LOC121367657 [Gigantopelta aegis]
MMKWLYLKLINMGLKMKNLLNGCFLGICVIGFTFIVISYVYIHNIETRLPVYFHSNILTGPGSSRRHITGKKFAYLKESANVSQSVERDAHRNVSQSVERDAHRNVSQSVERDAHRNVSQSVERDAHRNVSQSVERDAHRNVSQRPSVPESAVYSDRCDLSTDWGRNRTRDHLNLTSQVWVATHTTTDIFVYSAYYDVNADKIAFIRVIGVGLTSAKHHVICLVQWSADSTCLEDRPATVEIMPENQNKKYAALYVMCKLNESKNRKPYSVTITGHNCTQLKNRLLVNYPEPHRFNITICLSCIHSKYNDETETIQSIEIDQILGAEHFVVYNYSVGAEVNKVFNYYSSQGILDTRAWNLPKTEIHYFGQLAAISDCMYSNRGRSKYVIVKDLDEILVPYKDKTLPPLISRMMKKKPSAATIMFRHTVFQKTWPDEVKGFNNSQRASRFKLYSLLKIWREKYIWVSKKKCKTVFLPERVEIPGVHFSWKTRKGFVETEVPLKEGLVHHYRQWPIIVKNGKIKETFVRIYSKQLIDNYQRTFNLVHNISSISITSKP